jgi:hypothetical protein
MTKIRINTITDAKPRSPHRAWWGLPPAAGLQHVRPRKSVRRGVSTAPAAAWGQAALPFRRRGVPLEAGEFMAAESWAARPEN